VGDHADLGDHAQAVEAIEQRASDRGPLAQQHEHLGIFQTCGQRVHVLGVILPDRDVLTRHLLEGVERADRVLVIVEDRNLHGLALPGAP